ncbi:DNA-3-methyladenine glycosylase family protein [Streptomyces anulatus]|uniref:DNA-3-methyladenine glycosylase family protein n=1 Tax=Streptomyces anulatus TaxID=1892 RepID=UPI0035D5BA85
MTLLRLFPNGPTDCETALRMLAAHAIPGAEETDVPGRTHTRLLHHAGAPARVTVSFDEGQVVVELPDEIPDPGGLAAPVRRWLDLDSDTARIAGALAADPLIRPLVEHRPGIRLIGYPDEFEAVIATVVGQQVSLAAARTFMGRLVAAYGTPAAGLRILPAPRELAAIPDADLQAAIGLTGARARTLRAVAEKWADGFTLAHLPAGEARRALLALPASAPGPPTTSPCARVSTPTPSPPATWSPAEHSDPSPPTRPGPSPSGGRPGAPTRSCTCGRMPHTRRPGRRERAPESRSGSHTSA